MVSLDKLYDWLGTMVVVSTTKREVFVGELSQLSVSEGSEQFCLLIKDRYSLNGVCMPLVEYKIFDTKDCITVMPKPLYDLQKKLKQIEGFVEG